MPKIYIDAAVLAVPNYAIDPNSAQDMIERVIELYRIQQKSLPVKIVISDNIEEFLWSNNCGPGHDTIEEFLDLMEVDHIYAANDLVRAYQGILERSGRSSTHLSVDALTISSFSAVPPLPSGLGPRCLEVETERIFASVAASRKFDSAWMIGTALPGPRALHYSIAASIVSATGTDHAKMGALPANINGEVPTFAGMADLVTMEHGQRLWKSADSDKSIYLSIAIGAVALRRVAGLPATYSDIRQFSVGSAFLASTRQHQCSGESAFSAATYNLCCQIVAGTLNREVRQIGKPDQTLRSFDSAPGWRVHLTKSAEAMRLMFWDDGAILEFANVGVKNECQIENGSKRSAFRQEFSGIF